MSQQYQQVVVTLLGDRHASLHGREFARSREVIAEAGSLRDVLAEVPNLPVGRYSITVSEPYDEAPE